jgi:hypothetical protein
MFSVSYIETYCCFKLSWLAYLQFPRHVFRRCTVQVSFEIAAVLTERFSNFPVFYSRDVHPVARVIKSQDKNPRLQQSVNMLYCVLSMITTCFGLRKRPSSGDILYYMIITWRWPLTKTETCRDHGEHTIKHTYGLLRTRVYVLWFPQSCMEILGRCLD